MPDAALLLTVAELAILLPVGGSVRLADEVVPLPQPDPEVEAQARARLAVRMQRATEEGHEGYAEDLAAAVATMLAATACVRVAVDGGDGGAAVLLLGQEGGVRLAFLAYGMVAVQSLTLQQLGDAAAEECRASTRRPFQVLGQAPGRPELWLEYEDGRLRGTERYLRDGSAEHGDLRDLVAAAVTDFVMVASAAPRADGLPRETRAN